MKKGYTYNLGDIVVSRFLGPSDFESVSRDNCHDRFEIIYALSSLGSCTVEGNEYSLNQRSLLLIPPLSFHNHNLGDGACCEGYSVRFSSSILSEKVLAMLDKIANGEDNRGRFYSSDSVCDALNDVFRRFDDADILPEAERRVFLETLICEAVVFLSATEGKTISHTEHELGARVAKYLNSNIEKNISLDRLAGRFFVSKYHLCRAFKKYSGTSVHSYINQKRILYAKQLIESGETASGAAERVGFGDYSAFYRAYVKIVGRSPTKE